MEMKDEIREYPNGMTVGELKQLIRDIPDNAEVWIANKISNELVLSAITCSPDEYIKTGYIQLNDYSEED